MPLQTTPPNDAGVVGLEEVPFPPGFSLTSGGASVLPADEKAIAASIRSVVDATTGTAPFTPAEKAKLASVPVPTASETYVDAQDVVTLAAAEAYADAQDAVTLAAAEAYADAKLPVPVAWGRVTAAGPAYLYGHGTVGAPVLNGLGDWLINVAVAMPQATTEALVSSNSLAPGTEVAIEHQTDTQYRVQTSLGGVGNSNIDFTFRLSRAV